MISRIEASALYIKTFQLFGCHFVDLNNTKYQSKLQKFLAYHAYVYFVLVVSFAIGTLINFIRVFSGNENFNYSFMESMLIIGVFTTGIITYTLNFYFRKFDQKFWKINGEIENLNERFLTV